MILRYVLLLIGFFELVDAFNHMPLLPSIITRRKLLTSSIFLPAIVQSAYADDEENRPLTSEELEEYNRLLKEAQRIKSILDANIKAANEELSKEKKELENK